MEQPATPGQQPANPAPATPATPVAPAPATVTLTKEQHDQLVKDAARAAANQSDADRWRKANKPGSRFKPNPVTPPSDEERASQALEEDRKAERGLIALAADPALREVLDADPTLRTLLTTNPLAILPMYAPDALDAEDAVSLVRDAIAKRAKPATPPAPPANPPAPATPPAGAINANDKPVNEEVEAARKHPNTERAVAGMIGAKLKQSAGKK